MCCPVLGVCFSSGTGDFGKNEGLGKQWQQQLLLERSDTDLVPLRQFSYPLQFYESTQMYYASQILYILLVKGYDNKAFKPHLQNVFDLYGSSNDAVIPPDSLRQALSDHFQERFFVGEMADASEALVSSTQETELTSS